MIVLAATPPQLAAIIASGRPFPRAASNMSLPAPSRVPADDASVRSGVAAAGPVASAAGAAGDWPTQASGYELVRSIGEVRDDDRATALALAPDPNDACGCRACDGL